MILIKLIKLIDHLNTQDYFLKISDAYNPCLFLTSGNVHGNSVAKRHTKLLNLLTYALSLIMTMIICKYVEIRHLAKIMFTDANSKPNWRFSTKLSSEIPAGHLI